MEDRTTRTDAAVIGGGLAGLAAAEFLARRGHSVVLFERSRTLGGRAMTQTTRDYRMNLGPHALYRRGAGARVLHELGVRFTGGVPSTSGAYALDRAQAHALPGGFVSLLTTGLLGPAGKLEAARVLAGLPRLDALPWQRTTVDEYLAREIRQPAVRALVQALFRLSTYANDPARQSAGTAIAQLQLALATGVTYVDGGWQTLVDGLRTEAEAHGVRIVAGRRVEAVEHDGRVRAVRLRDGARVPVAAAIVAAGPAEAAQLVPDVAALARNVRDAVPVRAACLDVALGSLPRPRARFALGIDEPLYFSVHSAVAQLAPAGGALVHVAKYLPTDHRGDARADERQLEGTLDRVQPGWRAAVVERRFLPDMTVTHALPTAAMGGTDGRAPAAVPDVDGLFVAGDWVGGEGLLADASLASAREAARLASEAVHREAAAA